MPFAAEKKRLDVYLLHLELLCSTRNANRPTFKNCKILLLAVRKKAYKRKQNPKKSAKMPPKLAKFALKS